MKKISILSALTAAMALSIGSAQASMDMKNMDMKNMEKCMVTGESMSIKAGKNDCQTGHHSCAGQTKGHDKEDWIYVPKGDCMKINKGDWTGISEEIKDKIDMPAMPAK
jgi:uncharacterized membrane protein